MRIRIHSPVNNSRFFIIDTYIISSRRRIACIAALEQRKNAEERRMAVKEEGSSLDRLPEECVREVLLRLSDSKDIITAGRLRQLGSAARGVRARGPSSTL